MGKEVSSFPQSEARGITVVQRSLRETESCTFIIALLLFSSSLTNFFVLASSLLRKREKIQLLEEPKPTTRA